MFRIRPTFLLLAALLVSLSACDLINPAEDIPAYIYIEPFEVQTTPAEGTNSAKITEAWLSVGPNFLGPYSLPALVPVLEQGEQEIVINAGIKDNGISSSPDIYPFYTPYTLVLDLQPNEVDTIKPVVTYKSSARFAINETFQTGGHLFKLVELGPEIQITSDGAFEGNSAIIQLTTDEPVVEIATNLSFDNILDNDIRVYVELNYRSDVPVIFGLTGLNNNSQGFGTRLYEPGFSAKSTWNKIYFNLSGTALQGQFESFRLAFFGFIPEDANGELTLDEAKIYLDNIKLIHF